VEELDLQAVEELNLVVLTIMQSLRFWARPGLLTHDEFTTLLKETL
jgi:hypothetical protein